MEQQNVVENITRTITDTLKEMAKTETVVGKPFQLGDFSVVPVMSISMGIGTGGSNHEKEEGKKGVGGGAGLKVEPLAFLVANGTEVNILNLEEVKLWKQFLAPYINK